MSKISYSTKLVYTITRLILFTAVVAAITTSWPLSATPTLAGSPAASSTESNLTNTPQPTITPTVTPTLVPISREAVEAYVDKFIDVYEWKTLQLALAKYTSNPNRSNDPSLNSDLIKLYILNRAVETSAKNAVEIGDIVLRPYYDQLRQSIFSSVRPEIRDQLVKRLESLDSDKLRQILGSSDPSLTGNFSAFKSTFSIDLLEDSPSVSSTIITNANDMFTAAIDSSDDLVAIFNANRDKTVGAADAINELMIEKAPEIKEIMKIGPPALDTLSITNTDPMEADLFKSNFNEGFPPDHEYTIEELLPDIKVGGIIIGRPVSGKGNLNVANVSWTFDKADKTIQFVVTDDNHNSLTSMNFNAQIAYLSLLYAADKRPLAVSNIAGKIFIHPALAGTSLGQDILTFDNYIFASGAYDSLQSQVTCSINLYKRAAELFRYVNRGGSKSDLSGDFSDFDITGNQDWNGCDLSSISSSSLLEKEKDYFDEGLVEQLIKFVTQDSATSLYDWLYDYFAKQSSNAYNAFLYHCKLGEECNISVSSLDILDYYGVYSHVTEHLYEASNWELPTVAFSSCEVSTTDNIFTPFDFTMQVDFQYAPLSAGSGYIDKNLWQFDSAKPEIQHTAERYIAEDPSRCEIMQNVYQFTMLQRLFRAILSNRVSPDFPMEKLVTLVNDLSAYAP